MNPHEMFDNPNPPDQSPEDFSDLEARLADALKPVDPPAGFALPSGAYYNKYFPGHATSMPKPLVDGQIVYTDSTPAKVDQYTKDVTAFMMWVAEPTMEGRKRLGFQAMVFLIVLAGLLYFTKKKVWAEVH